jgi:hypothetical protein
VETRGCLGGVYRLTKDFLVERGLLEEVKAKLSPPSRAVLDKLPFSFAWQEAAALEEIEQVLHAKSPQLTVDLGYAAAKYFTDSIVAPVLKMAASLFGQTPETVFGNLDRFFSIAVRGFAFRYEREGDRRGNVIVQISGGPTHPSLFLQLKGNLSIAFPICRVDGTIGDPVVLGSHEVSFPVSWR